jgi:SAM-dependent methyltransferase
VSDWWRDFFDQDYVDIYGSEDAKKSEMEVEGIFGLLEPQPACSILDLCCGYGRHAIGLAQRGLRVTGLDFSPALLRKAQSDAVLKGTQVSFVRGDMRDLPFSSQFDIVINMFTAFGYFDTEGDDQKVMNCVRNVLKPGGEFLMDTINREWVLSRFKKEHWEEVGHGKYALDLREFDPVTSRIGATTLVLGDNGRTERRHSMRLYTLTEMVALLQNAGMSLRSVHGHMDGRRYWMDTPRMVVRAFRPAA